MRDLYDIIFQSLEKSTAQRLNITDSARSVVRHIERAGGASVINVEMINNLKTLNAILIKIMRDLFPLKTRDAFESILKAGMVYSPEGVKELCLKWDEFYREKTHLQALNEAARCIMLTLQNQSQITNKGFDLIKLMQSQPQMVCNTDFLKKVAQLLSEAQQKTSITNAGHKNPANHPISARQEAARQYIKRLEMAEQGNVSGSDVTYSPSAYSASTFANFSGGAMTQGANTFELNQDAYAATTSEKFELSHLLMSENAPHAAMNDEVKKSALNLTKGIKTDLYKDLGDFLLGDCENKQRLCAIRIKNVDELVDAFGADGYARAISSIKALASSHFKAMSEDTKVFSPHLGVLYAIAGDAYGEKMAEFASQFCSQKRTFAFKGARVSLEFDARIFDKANGFLCTIIEMQSFLD